MAAGPKQFCAVALPAGALTDLYTAPLEAVVSTIVVCNRGVTATSFRLSHAASGAADDPGQYFAYDLPISPNTMVPFTMGICLEIGDVLRGYAANANVTVTAWGEEQAINNDMGASYFLELVDTPASYVGESGRAVLVNPTEDGLVFGTVAGESAPVDAAFITAATNAVLSGERVLTDTLTVAWDFATPGQAKATIPDTAITYAKMQNLSAPNKLLGRYSAGAGVVQELTVSTGLALDASGNLTATGGGGTNYWDRTAGVLSPLTATDSLKIGADALFVDAVNKRVGVSFYGLPIYPLSVYADMTGWTENRLIASIEAEGTGSASGTNMDGLYVGLYPILSGLSAVYTPLALYVNADATGGAANATLTMIDLNGAGLNNASLYITGILCHNPTLSSGAALIEYIGLSIPDMSTTNLLYGFRSDIAAGTNKFHLYCPGTAPTYLNGKLGLGKQPGTEILELSGAINLGAAAGTANGTIRYTGTDIEGRVGNNWLSLTATGGGGAPTGAQYLVGATDATLSAERLVTDTASITWDLATAGQAKANIPTNGIATAMVTNANITYAKLQNVSTNNRLLGRSTAGAGVVEEVTVSTGLALAGGNLTAAAKTFRLGHTWALAGDVTLFTTLPSIFIALTGAQTATLIGIRAKIASGTSVGVQTVRNAGNVGSVVTVTTTATTTTAMGPVTLANNDELTFVLSSPTGTPTHLSLTLLIDYAA